MPCARAEILGEALRAFERGGRRARAEGGDARRLRARSTSPATSGASGPTTTKSMRSLPAESDEPVDVGRGDRRRIRPPRRCRHCRARRTGASHQRRGGDRPAQRVLAPARSDHQHDVHPRTRTPLPRRSAAAASCIIGGDDRIPPTDRRAGPRQPARIHRLRTLGGAQALDRGEFLAMCGCAARSPAASATAPAIAISRSRTARRCSTRCAGATTAIRLGDQARRRDGGGVHRPPHHLSRPLEIPARHRYDRARRRSARS